MEKETLEDAAERNHNEQRLNTYTPYSFYDAFKDGAKWQAERMYSEEDLEYAFEQGKLNSNICYRRTFKNVLEILQFKNK